jgi:glycolate oxidase FAD binding subunit
MTDLIGELVQQVQHAYATKTPLKIEAGNTKAYLGRATSDEVINVADHSGVISYSPTELVIRARAGTKISQLNEVLAEQQQRLPFEPPAFSGEATIGGTVAANQSGPARPWFGGVKDSLLGLGLINGYGEAMQFGGQVMKNVAGFDVTRLQCGAMGSLGLITDVSIKVLPQFNAGHTLTFEMAAEEALEAMLRWANLSLPITGMSHVQSKNMLYIRLQGGESGVASASQLLGGAQVEPNAAEEFWQAVREGRLLQPQHNQTLWRWSGPRDAPIHSVPNTSLINWAGSERWVLADSSKLPENGLIQHQGGDRLAEVYGSITGPQKALKQRIKHAFDPYRVLNAGRVYSWM